MKWSQRHATGVESIDHQHQVLFQMVADYRAALDEKRGDRVFGAMLSALTTYTKAHFRHEEAELANTDGSLVARNVAEHRAFEFALDGWRARFDAAGFRVEDAHALMDMLEHWLDTHISGVDVQLTRPPAARS